MATDILKEQFNNLQAENDLYKSLINQQKDHLASLDREISVAESRIQEKQTVPGGLVKQQGKHKRHRKYIYILENKLSQDTLRFDELLCSNTEYRQDIAHLLQQKSIGRSIEEKFNSQLAKQKNIIENLEKKFTLTVNQGSEAKARMLEARENIEVETAHFTKRQMQLKTTIDHETKLQTFMKKKLQEMIPLEYNEDFKKRRRQQQNQHGVKRLEMYVQGHSTLVEVTGERDLSQIGRMFIQIEQKNFALISYINELQNRRNMLKSCTIKMKSEILFLERESKGHDEQSESQLKDIESELEMYSHLADSLEQQCSVIQRTLDQLRTAISGLLDEVTQEGTIVTFDNIAHFTSILEEKVSNLLIQANEQMIELPQNLLFANCALLPELEAAAETEISRSSHASSRSLKSA